jgi:HlyD family type I secretion membrane fusion protein
MSTRNGAEAGLALPTRPATGGLITAGIAIIGAFAALLAGWAMVAPLSSAAVAHGQVKVESSRKTVQHLEGGIVRDILVREGDLVKAGQVLLRLDPTQSDAAATAARGERDVLLAAQARCRALRDKGTRITFPDELVSRRDDPRVATLMASETALFEGRRAQLAGARQILEQQVAQSEAETRSYQAQVASTETQSRLIADEVSAVKDLLAKGLERKTRLLALEREAAALEGTRGNLQGLIARARQRVGELQLQMSQIEATAEKERADEQNEVERKLAQNEQQMRSTTDVLTRSEVLAPTAGRVLDLRAVTLGGVVRPGDPIMDIVPLADRLVVEAQVQPSDIDVVHEGLAAEVRLTAYKQRVVPVLMGRVVRVSADAVERERTGQFYYRADVEIEPSQLAAVREVSLVPGMPADVMIDTGRQTLASYLVRPLVDSFHRAMRED